MLGQNLNRHFPVELRIPRPIHFVHASGAERAEDLVRTQVRAGDHGHGFRSARQGFQMTTHVEPEILLNARAPRLIIFERAPVRPLLVRQSGCRIVAKTS